MLDLAWQKVKASTIANCFAKAGLSKDQQKYAQSDDNHCFRDLQNQIEKLGGFYPPGTTAGDVISGDKKVIIAVILQIVEKVMNAAVADDVNDEENDDGRAVLDPVCPKVSDVGESLQVLHDYMPWSLSGQDLHKKLSVLSISIDKVTAKMRQSDVRTFF